jgi:parvulin-like peptidyl-prolyl isomerase
VFLDRRKHGDQLDADAAALLAKLKQQPLANISTLGDPLLLPQECADEAQRDAAAQFGQTFAGALTELKLGEWSGPIQSGYGAHLVLVTRRTEGRLPPLGEVRDQVKRELLDTRRAQANQRFFENLLSKYHVTIEPISPQVAPTVQKVAMN